MHTLPAKYGSFLALVSNFWSRHHSQCQMPLVCHVTHDLTSYLFYFLKDQVRPKEAENMCSSPSPRPGRSHAIRVCAQLSGRKSPGGLQAHQQHLLSRACLPCHGQLSHTLGTWRRMLSGLKAQNPTVTATEKPTVLKNLQGWSYRVWATKS